MVTNYTQLFTLAIVMGIAKGVRTVYAILVIPSHVPIEKLGSASGIRMSVNGIALMFLGPVVGK